MKNDHCENIEKRKRKPNAGRPVAGNKELEIILDAMIDEKISGSTDLDQAILQDRYNLLKRHRSIRTRKNNGEIRTYRDRTYGELANEAKAMGIPIVDVFARAGMLLDWPSDDAKQVYEQISCLNKSDVAKLEKLIQMLSPLFWRPDGMDCKMLMPTLGQRIYFTIRYSLSIPAEQIDMVRSWEDDDLLKVWTDRKHWTLPTPKSIIHLSKILNLSPAWLFMMLDEHACLLTDSYEEEYIMTGYLFLSEENKKIVRDVLNTMVKGGRSD